MWQKIKKHIAESPLFKTLVGVFSLVVFSVLSGTFVTEITRNGMLDWRHFYYARSFYALLACTFLMYLYFRFQFQHEQSIERFRDDEYCRAYMRKEYLPELAERVKGLIRQGEDGDELRGILDSLDI